MSKGGMCINPFGGFARPDKIELLPFLGPNDPPEKAVILATMTDAFQNYAYFGLGDVAPDGSPRGNGTTAENFYFDFLYFFVIRSDRPETYEHARVMKDTFIDDVTGKRQTRLITLDDETLRMMTFDFQFRLLNFPFGVEDFLKKLRAHRLDVLTTNAQQIRAHVRLLREYSVTHYAPGHSLPLFLEDSGVDMRILLEPHSAEEVEELVGYLPKCFRKKAARERAIPTFNAALFAAVETVACAYAEPKGPVLECLYQTVVPGVGDDPGHCHPGMSA